MFELTLFGCIALATVAAVLHRRRKPRTICRVTYSFRSGRCDTWSIPAGKCELFGVKAEPCGSLDGVSATCRKEEADAGAYLLFKGRQVPARATVDMTWTE